MNHIWYLSVTSSVSPTLPCTFYTVNKYLLKEYVYLHREVLSTRLPRPIMVEIFKRKLTNFSKIIFLEVNRQISD